MSGNLRDIVNGALLAHHVGQNVSVTGLVTDMNPNGVSFEMRTVDNMTVTVNLQSPLDDMLDGYVEVHGKCLSRNMIQADDYIHFSAEQSADFDLDGHNKMCAKLQQCQRIFTKYSEKK